VLAGHQTEVGTDAGAGEALPVSDLNRQRETGQRGDAPQAGQAPGERRELAVTRDRGDLLFQSVTASLGQQHCLIRFVESGLRRGRIQALMTQPTIMQLAPGFAVVIDDPVPQQQLGQPVPAAHQILPGSFAGADQVTARRGRSVLTVEPPRGDGVWRVGQRRVRRGRQVLSWAVGPCQRWAATGHRWSQNWGFSDLRRFAGRRP